MFCPNAGYSIKSYRDGEALSLFVNKIFSDKSQVQHAYFDLPFVCPPTGKKHGSSPFGSGQSVSLNLGEVLRGDRIMVSDFELAMGKDVECNFLCNREINRKNIGWVKELISDGYVAEWIVDNLPGATSFMTIDNTRKYYGTGFKLGYQDTSTAYGRPRYFIYNHFTFVIRWREAPGKAGAKGGKVIVGFEVYPKSIDVDNRSPDGCPADVHDKHPGFELHIQANSTQLALDYPDSSYLPDENDDAKATLSIPYSYSVYFRKETKVGWSNRWELYLYNQQGGKVTHWLAVLNSMVISGALGITVLVIWGRTTFGDKGRGDGSIEDGNLKLKPRKSPTPNPEGEPSSTGLLDKGDSDGDLSPDEELDDTAVWKQLHGDVFRTPAYSGLLAPLVGSGMQLLFVAVGLLILSCLGVLNPSYRGGFTSVGMGLFVFAGIFSGYFSARLYNTFGGKSWRRNTLIVSIIARWLGYTVTNEILDWIAIPWFGIFTSVRFESLCLDSGVEHCPPIWHAGWPRRSLAPNTSSACLHWQLVGLRESKTVEPPHADECDSATNPSSTIVYGIIDKITSSRPYTVCCSLR